MRYKEYKTLELDDKFNYFIDTLSLTNRTPEYYVNWEKATNNLKPHELSLHTLNYLVGKENIKNEARKLFVLQPDLLKTIPLLIGIRENNFNVLIFEDINQIGNVHLDFNNIDLSSLEDYLDFIEDSGLFNFMANDLNKSLVDYVYGVEVGLDSNARKNRSGSVMESLLDRYVNKTCDLLGFDCFSQASASKIKKRWNIDVPVDKSSRRFDSAIYDESKNKCYLIETNYYGGGGSKLKSVAGEFSGLNNFINESSDNIEFIWVTDGQGWHTAKLPLKEAFTKIEYIFNIEMLSNDFLYDILRSNNRTL